MTSGLTVSVTTPLSSPPLAEAEHNRLLRRADWRYLLPDPSPRRVVCVARGSLRASAALVAAHVDESPRAGIAYDLAILENPDDATLRTIAASLRPGGVCYVEWRTRTLVALRAVRARMARAGFEHLRCYQPWPSPDRCHAWIPVRSPAGDHFWRTAPHSTRVLRERLRNVIGRIAARLGVHHRLCGVALAPSASAGATGDPALIRIAARHGAIPDAPGARAATSLLLLTPGERSVGKVVALGFDSGAAPCLALKTSRTPAAGSGLLHEANVLDAVHAHDLPGVPRVLFRDTFADAPVVAETALTGIPLAATLRRRTYPALASRVTDWLTMLARRSGTPVPEDPWTRVTEPALQRFADEFAPVLDPAMLRDTHDILRAIGPLPVTCEQRDCAPWNVLDGVGGLVVLDWESGEPRGVPALDLVYFLTHAAFYLERAWVSGRFVEAYRAAWARDSVLGGVHHACATAYLGALDLEPARLRSLRLLAWVLHAHSEYVHFHADARGTPSADQLRRSRFLTLWDDELRHGQ